MGDCAVGHAVVHGESLTRFQGLVDGVAVPVGALGDGGHCVAHHFLPAVWELITSLDPRPASLDAIRRRMTEREANPNQQRQCWNRVSAKPCKRRR